MVDVMTKLCDICRGDSATGFEVHFPDGLLAIDLCTKHQRPLSDMRDAVSDSLFTPKGARRRKDRIAVDPTAI